VPAFAEALAFAPYSCFLKYQKNAVSSRGRSEHGLDFGDALALNRGAPAVNLVADSWASRPYRHPHDSR
jgi:hypothetical protein